MTLLRYFPVVAARTDYSSRFVPEGTKGHHGCDVFAAMGSPVVAVTDGTARKAEDRKGGHVVYLDGGPVKTYYAHLTFQSPALSTTGTRVRAGEILGAVGDTGNAKGTAPHLHFQLRLSGALVDPFPFLKEVDPARGGDRPILDRVPEWLRGVAEGARGVLPSTEWLKGFLSGFSEAPAWALKTAAAAGGVVLGWQAILAVLALYMLSRKET